MLFLAEVNVLMLLGCEECSSISADLQSVGWSLGGTVSAAGMDPSVIERALQYCCNSFTTVSL